MRTVDSAYVWRPNCTTLNGWSCLSWFSLKGILTFFFQCTEEILNPTCLGIHFFPQPKCPLDLAHKLACICSFSKLFIIFKISYMKLHVWFPQGENLSIPTICCNLFIGTQVEKRIHDLIWLLIKGLWLQFLKNHQPKWFIYAFLSQWVAMDKS